MKSRSTGRKTEREKRDGQMEIDIAMSTSLRRSVVGVVIQKRGNSGVLSKRLYTHQLRSGVVK
jgi:hypothetical protein